MLDVVEMQPISSQSTSWTCNNVTYYLHTVNAGKVITNFN